MACESAPIKISISFSGGRSYPGIILVFGNGYTGQRYYFFSRAGQAYSDGIALVQFYFGLPLAMIVLCITLCPYSSP